MEFIRIKDINNKYWNEARILYRSSFPIYEKRTIDDQKEAMKNEKFHCYVAVEEEKLIGIVFFWDFNKYRYIEHLAVTSDFRGKGYGSKILSKICSEEKRTILEIDPPIDEKSIKRLEFYKKAGFLINDYEHVHPPYRSDYRGHELLVLSYKKELTDEDYEVFNYFLTNRVMKYSET